MIAILGGGLTGLSAAYHLRDLPHVVLEAEGTPGGLCRTREVGGFLFDDTGHLLHVRDPRAIALVDRLLPGAFRVVERRAFVRTRGVTVPFPFQANLHGLPPDVVEDCLVGFLESLAAPRAEGEDASFEEWVLATLGSGIGRAFATRTKSTVRGKLLMHASHAVRTWLEWLLRALIPLLATSPTL